MKKLFVILSVSLLLASCSHKPAETTVATTTDSTVVKVDTAKAKVDTTAKAVVDTTKKK